jgi:hypothetical protein
MFRGIAKGSTGQCQVLADSFPLPQSLTHHYSTSILFHAILCSPERDKLARECKECHETGHKPPRKGWGTLHAASLARLMLQVQPYVQIYL